MGRPTPQHGWAALPSDIVATIALPLQLAGDTGSLTAIRLACRSWNQALCQNVEKLSPQLLHSKLHTIFPQLRQIDLTCCPALQAGQITALQAFTNLALLRVTLPNGGQTMALAAEIAQLRSLTALDISGSKLLSDDDMEALARQGALQELGIADCMLLSDEAMQHIVHLLPGLQSLKFPTQCRGLHFPTSQITNDTCSTLASLTDLQALDLRNHDELGEEGLLHLSLLSRLTCLRLANHRGLTDMGLRGISTLRALRSLQLTYSLGQPAWLELFTADFLSYLVPLTNMEKLILQGLNWDRPARPLPAPLNMPFLTELDCSHIGSRLGRLTVPALLCFPLSQLQRLDVRRNRLDGQALQLGFCSVQRLELSGCSSLRVDHLRHLSRLTHLELLHLDDCEGLQPCNMDDWAFLRCLQGLTSFSWANRFGGPSWFASEAELDDLPRVQALARHAACLKHLQRLCISRQALDPVVATLRLIGTMTRLTLLDLEGTFCEEEDAFNAALTCLQPLTQLQVLNLAGTGLCGQGLAHLSTIQGLRELNVSKAPVTDAGLRYLKPFTRLATLRMDDQRMGDMITEEGLRKIGHISTLRILSIRGNTQIQAPGLAHLSSNQGLRVLDVRGCLNIDAHAAMRHLQACSSLAEIDLGDWDGVRHTPICTPLPLVLESDLHLLRRRLPFLRHIDFGGQVVTCRRQYVASRMQASMRRLIILSLKAFLRLEKFYSAAVDLPARGAAAGLLHSLGLAHAPRSKGPPAASATAAMLPLHQSAGKGARSD